MDSPSSSSQSRSLSNSSTGRSRQGLNGMKCVRRWNDIAKRSGVKFCKCGMECEYYTSMTDKNPCRRFYRCPDQHAGGCGLWEWFDKPMCSAATQFIPLFRDELTSLRNTLLVKEELIARGENELRGCHEHITKLKEEIEWIQHEAESSFQEVVELGNVISKLEATLVVEKRKRTCHLILCLIVCSLLMYFVKNCLYCDM